MTDYLPDLCDLYSDNLALLSQSLVHYGGRHNFYGEVVTIRCYEDNSRVKEMLSTDGCGKVLIIDGQGSTTKALLGDLIAQSALDNGWQGVIVYGAIRDVAQIAQMNLGVMALAVSPFKTKRMGIGETQVPLMIDDLMIHPKSYVYADLNGAILSEQQLDIESYF